MSHTIEIRRVRRGAVIVPACEVEMCLAMGWVLCDEPHCSGARMLPPSSVHRVPDNEKAGRGGTREPAKNIVANNGKRTGHCAEMQRR